MKLLCPRLMLLAVLVLPLGCAKKTITDVQRKQAATLASEADFALTVHDYPRAEKALDDATKLCPDTAAYWLSLGSARVKQGKRDAARDAYRQALRAFEDAADANKADAGPALQQVYVLALLGRVDDARALQEKLLKRYPDNRDVRAFVDQKQLDRTLADPGFKQFAL